MTRPIRARIDLDALRHNFRIARERATPAQVWAVVKADAYGHGLLPVATALRDLADGYALVELEGAIALRDAGFNHPILLMEGPYDAEEWGSYAEYGLTATLHSPWQVTSLVDAGLPVAPDVCLKLETGMHRLGLDAEAFQQALGQLFRSRAVRKLSLMSHFADADGERGIEAQMARFDALAGDLELPRTLANSAALLRFPELVCRAGDATRPGIMLYGASPFPAMQSAEALELQPVMTLESELIAVKQLSAGDRVGYGGLFAAPAPMRVGIVAGGYADGYPRHAPTGTPILVAGQRTRLLGRVSMDKICVDLTPIKSAVVGSPVTLWGQDGDSGVVLPADEVADAAGTIAYELFCALARRVPRDYINT